MFTEHHKPIWRTLRRLGMTPEAAADTTQQAYVVAAERLADIDEGKERAFLFGVALRLAKASHRKSRRYVLEDELDDRVHPVDSAFRLTERHAAMHVLDRVLANLDPDLATVLLLFELEGLSTPEISTTLSIPVGTAASRLQRARRKFQASVDRLHQPPLRRASQAGTQ